MEFSDDMLDDGAEEESSTKEPTPAPKAPAKKKVAAKAKPKPAEQALTLEASAENIAIELRKRLDELLAHAGKLLAEGEAVMSCRATAMQLDEIAKREGFALDDAAKAGNAAIELRIKADLDTLKASSGVDIMSNGVERYTLEECTRVFASLDGDFGLESDVVKDKLASFKEALLRRHNELVETATQVSPAPPVDTSVEESEPEVVIEEESPIATEEPPVELTRPRAPDAPDTPTEPAQADPETPARPANVVGEHAQITPRRARLNALWLRLRSSTPMLVLGIAIGAILLFAGALAALVLLANSYEGGAENIEATGSAQNATSSDAGVPESIPEGVEVPTTEEPVSEPEPPVTIPPPVPDTPPVPVPDTAPATGNAFTCVPFPNTRRCEASGGSTVSQEMLDVCANMQANPRFTSEEHARFWDCGDAYLDLDDQGRQDTCVPACCFCRYD